MRILITGGLGFIGSELTRLIRRLSEHELVLLDSLSVQVHGEIPVADRNLVGATGVTVVRGEVGDRRLLARVLPGVNAIVHLAAETGTAQSMYEVARYNMVNSQGTAILLDWLANNPHDVSKLVLASSRSIYGEGAYSCVEHGEVYPPPRSAAQLARAEWEPVCPSCARPVSTVPTRESARPRPASMYAATKYAQEDLMRIAGESLGIGTVILRLQNVYGAGQSLQNPYTGILSVFSTRIRRGLSLPIFEDGLESRDFVHVEDVARAFLLAVENDTANGATINVGSGKPTTVHDIARMLVDLLGGERLPEVTGQFRVGDIRHCYADLATARVRLGFAPSVSLRQGLEKFAAWVSTQPIPEDRLDRANEELKSRGMMS